MSRVVSIEGFTPGERFDNLPWINARFEESASLAGTYSSLGAQVLSPVDADPSNPQSRDFTFVAGLASGYYRVVFIDAAGHEQIVGPVFAGAGSSSYTSVLAVRRVLAPDGSLDPSTAASLSEDEIEAAIDEASAEIDGRLAALYTVPLSAPVPPIVEALNRDIAAYLATLVFRRGDPIDARDPVQLRYDRAQAMLSKLENGKAELVVDSGVEVGRADEAAVINPYDGDLFTLEGASLGSVNRWPWEG